MPLKEFSVHLNMPKIKPVTGRAGRLFFVLACLAVLCACTQDLRPGEVARVNGRSISFSLLSAAHLGMFPDSSATAETPQFEAMRQQYTSILFQLICQELVCEFMEKKEAQVSPEEVAAEEALIRADYPEGAFGVMLLEEGVDLEEWRHLLRNRLTVERFHARYLRPGISITAEEIQEYYQAHAEELAIPEQWHFIQISGSDKTTVDKASLVFRQTRNATLAQQGQAVSMRDIRTDRERLPEDLLHHLDPLASWSATPTFKREEEFHSYVLLEKTPRTPRTATETFYLVEQAVIEDKLHEAYLGWLKKRLAKASVKVVSPLLPFKPAGKQTGTKQPGQ